MIRRSLAILRTVTEYAAFSAVQFILSFAIGAHLPTAALAEFTISLLIATFGASTLRSAFLTPLLYAGEGNPTSPSKDEWITLICCATAVCGSLTLIVAWGLYVCGFHLAAVAAAASVPLLMTMALYDISRRRTDAGQGTAIALLLAFAGAVAVSTILVMSLPDAALTAIVASGLVSICYAVASGAFLRTAWRTPLTQETFGRASREARGSIASSPVIALATGAIMQGLPLLAMAGAPATLALFYLSRILAMPAVTLFQALDAMQKTALRSASRNDCLTRSALTTATGIMAVAIVYACAVLVLLPGLSGALGPTYGAVTAADVWAWTALLLSQVASGTADNAAYALDKPRTIAFGRVVGMAAAIAIWFVLRPVVLPEILATMATGFVVSAILTTALLACGKLVATKREQPA